MKGEIRMLNDFQNLIDELQNNDMGFILCQEGVIPNISAFVEFMSNSRYVGCQVYPLYYQHQPADVPLCDVTASRDRGVWALFQRWTACGYNNAHAKTPYGSKLFMKFLDEYSYMQADYLVMTEVIPYDES